MGRRARSWTAGAALAVLLVAGCDLHAPDDTAPSPSPSPTPSAAGPSPSPSTVVAAVSSDGGPLTPAETRKALATCLGGQASPRDVEQAQVEYARAIAYLTDDVRTLPTIVLRSKGERLVCNTDGRVSPTPGAALEPDSAHPAVVIATAGVTGTFNGPFADGMSPFAPCVVLRVTSQVATVVMRLDWPTGDSVWYGAAIENGYAVVSGWMGGTIGVPVDIDLRTVRTQLRAFDITGRELPVR